MDINAFNALKTYGNAQKTLGTPTPMGGQGQQNAAPKPDFDPANFAKDVVQTVAKSESTASAFMTGQADPHSVVEAMASAELAVETAVTLRNRVVEAYQELLRMPV